MRATDPSDASAQSVDAVRLRVTVYDALASAHGYPTVVSQAAWHGLNKSSMSRIKNVAGNVSGATMMRIARDCGCPVEAIWELVA